MMITELGKYIRKLRIDKVVTLRQMADAIGFSPSYISSIETGKRKTTSNFLKSVVDYFDLSQTQEIELNRLAEISQKEISIPIEDATYEQKNSAIAFARRLNQLSSEDLKKINKILEEN